MEAVVLQRKPAAPNCFKEYGPWHFHDRRYTEVGRMDFGETLLHVARETSGPCEGLLETNAGRLSPRATTDDGDFLRTSPSAVATDSSPPDYGLSSSWTETARGSTPLSGDSIEPGIVFSFSQIAPTGLEAYDFPSVPSHSTPRPSLKRRRATSDVDGPNTASQGCKKRRLRKDMVTSRLSRPFSEPATHIITRDFGTSSDKHFLKVAAILSARQMGSASSTPAHHTSHPSPSSLLRRAAVINRFRLSVKYRAEERGDEDVADLAANAALLQPNHGVGFVVGARFPVTSSSAPLLVGLESSSGQGDAEQSIPPFQLSLAAVEARPRPKAATEASSRPKLSPSPRMRPLRSPVLRAVRPLYPVDVDDEDDGEGVDDQEVAFPTSEHESRYESADELDDVYADFGMIFGGGGKAEDEIEEDDGDHYEDYMDDMDGIPWTVR